MGKLAVHAHRPEKWIVDIASQANGKWVKMLFYSDLKDYWPERWTIARLMLPGLDAQEASYWKQGAYGVDAYINAVDNAFAPNRLDTLYGSGGHRVGYFELVNEAVWGNLEELQAFVDFEYATAFRYNQHQRRVLLGSFPPGRPDVNNKAELQVLAPLFEMASEPLNGLALHQYGHPKLSDEPEWYALRHRKLVRALRELGISVPRIWLTEFGADYWRRCYANSEDYAKELAWADAELQKDKEVVAAFAYTSGCPQEDRPKWREFEIDAGLWQKIIGG